MSEISTEAGSANPAARLAVVPSGAADRLSLTDLSLLVGINLLWAGSSTAAKFALVTVGPYTLGFLRFFPAGLLLLALHRTLHTGTPPSASRADRIGLLLLGLLGIGVTYGVFYAGLLRTTATDASLLIACEPVLIALFAYVFLRERLSRSQWAGLGLGLLGVYVITGQAAGNLIIFGSLCIESLASILGKRLTDRYAGLWVVGWEMVIGAVCLLPFALAECIRHPPVGFNGVSLAGVVYLGLGCSAIAYGVWYRLLGRFPVSVLGVSLLLQPLTGPLFGWLLRGETLGSRSAVGGALVIAGILLTTRSSRHNTKQ